MTTTNTNTAFDAITLEVDDVDAAQRFYADAFGIGSQLRFRQSSEPTNGFRGHTISLIVSQPANARALLDAAVNAGATVIKPAAKSLWGFGGVVQAPDGTIWQCSTSRKKDTEQASKEFESIVLLLGATDVSAAKKFYEARGVKVSKSMGSYAEFATGPIQLGLYKRAALAKAAGVATEGSGSHRIVINGGAGEFTDPDGFRWEASMSP